ncbi:FUSC family protein [Rhodococcus olei]|uniref:FUSC family protein n=1 Tax=Rhodococcus olei TaxID=2161675 RepID=A0ABP8NY12_9NOCA
MPVLTDSTRLGHSRGALVHSVSPATWRRAFDVHAADATIAISMRVALGAALVLVAFGLTGRSSLAGFAVLGALSIAFSRHEPLRRTAAKVGFVGALVVVSVVVGGLIALAAPPMWGQIAVIAVLSGLAAAVLTAFRVGGPGPVILIFAATAAVGSTGSPADLRAATVAAAVGAAVGFVTALIPFVFLPWGPARLAVARALAAAAAVPDGGRVDAAEAAIAAAREKLALTTGADGHAHLRDLAALLAEAEAALADWRRGDGTRLAAIVRHGQELRRVKQHTVIVGHPGAPADLPRPSGFFAAGAAGLRARSIAHHGGRIAVAAALAGWLAAAAGLGHPLWASMGAMAAMQGVGYAPTVQRAIQRLLGNVGGAVLAAAVLSASLGYWPTIAIVVVLQVAAEITATRNYALCSLFVTPMALLVVGLGTAVGPEIGLSRVLDNLIGVVVGVVVAAVTVSVKDRMHLHAST